MHSKFLIWDFNPIFFSSGKIHLPIPISVVGLILASVIYYSGYRYFARRAAGSGSKPGDVTNDEGADQLEPASDIEQKSTAVTQARSSNLSIMKVGLLIAASFSIGQLLTVPLHLGIIHAVGPLTIRWYALMWELAFLAGYLFGAKMFRDAGKPVQRLDSLFVYAIIGIVVGARLGQVFFYTPNFYFAHPIQILEIWNGGLASHGAVAGALIALWLYVRKYPDMKYFWLLDRIVIPVTLGGAFVRIGNFFNSEILGHVSHLPWAIIFERIDMLPRQPSMLYEAAWYFIGFFLLWWIYRRYKGAPPDGLIFGIFLVYVFSGRIMIEFTKTHQADFTAGWPIKMGQLLSIPFILCGIWLLARKVKYKEPA